MSKLKVCFIGLGSIGKRHLKNLVQAATKLELEVEVHAYRKTQVVLSEDILHLVDKQVFSMEELDCDYDISFITNPTSEHYKTIKNMAHRTKNFFIEKPIFENISYEIDSLKLNSEGIHYVAGPLRHSDIVRKLKDILPSEKVYSIRATCSSYLPDWRPEIDYRTTYSASKALGGGVSIDLIHELDYITYLFGFPDKLLNLNGKFSHLEIDSDDLSLYIGRYKDKLVEIHLDYFGKEARREIEILTDKGTIIGDFIRKRILFTDGRDTIDCSCSDTDMYIEEMKFFLSCTLERNKEANNMKHAYKVLKYAMEGHR